MESNRKELQGHMEIIIEDSDWVVGMISKLSDDDVAAALQSYNDDETAKVALRSRLMDDSALRNVVCPPTTWKTPADRHEVSKHALSILENFAETAGVTVEAMIAGFAAEKHSMTRSIEMFGDPRSNEGWPWYEWKCRCNDAVKVATASRKRDARLAWEASVVAAGREVCDRCGGAGGHSGWPGFTCYKCDGHRTVGEN
jgi:hypothetical protein